MGLFIEESSVVAYSRATYCKACSLSPKRLARIFQKVSGSESLAMHSNISRLMKAFPKRGSLSLYSSSKCWTAVAGDRVIQALFEAAERGTRLAAQFKLSGFERILMVALLFLHHCFG